MIDFHITNDTLLSILTATPIGMILVASNGDIVFVNQRAEEIFDYKKNDLLAMKIEALIPDNIRPSHASFRANYLKNPSARFMGAERILMGRARNGEHIPVEIGLSPVPIEDETYILASIIDLSDRHKVSSLEKHNEQLKHQATRDFLTGLPNRRLFTDLLQQSMRIATRNKTSIGLMFIDLDGFKAVNDELGHDAGDVLLCKVADIINSTARKSDFSARFGGDEFVMCLNDINGDESSVLHLAENLIKKITAVSMIQNQRITVSASIGLLIVADASQLDSNQFITHADQLMYRAKREGKSRVVLDSIFPRNEAPNADSSS